jgi:hypothetical protein
MLDSWRERRRLTKELAAHKKAKPTTNHRMYYSIYVHLEEKIREHDTNRLIHKARHLGIDIAKEVPYSDDIWSSKPEVAYLTDKGVAKLSQLVREKQRAIIKMWSELYAPILSTLISILALIVSIIALIKS